MPVQTPHKDYTATIARWTKCRDVYDGAHAVKAKGDTYLPRIGAHKDDAEKYHAYKQRAVFYGGTRRTVQGLAGAIFQKELTFEAPTEVEKHLDDITLTNTPIGMVALDATHEVFLTGRYGILVDMAASPDPDEAEAPTSPKNPVRPYWVCYRAEDIISWRTERIDGNEVLTRVVLREMVEVQNEDDEFIMDEIEQYHVLELVEGVYWQSIYQQAKNGEWEVIDEPVAATRRKKTLDFIPFIPLSPDSVSIDVKRPPMEDVADLNISHYQTMADLEWGLHWTALPTIWIAGHAGKTTDPLPIGSGVALKLVKEGRAGMLEFKGEGLKQLVTSELDKRKMMATLGARMLEDQPAIQETATAITMRHAGEHATLRTVASAIQAGLTMALQIHTWWLANDPKPSDVKASISLNKDFLNIRGTPEEIKALLLLWQSDAISYNTFYAELQKGEWGRADIDADAEKKEIENEVEMRRKEAEENMPPALEPGAIPTPPGGDPNAPPTNDPNSSAGGTT